MVLADLAVGVPWVQAHNLEARMKEERCSYLVQELSCKVILMSIIWDMI